MNLWFRLGHAIHRALSAVVVAAVFFGVVTPVALLSRALRDDPLQRAFEPTSPTYWREVDPAVDDEGLWAFFAQRGRWWMLPVALVVLGVGAMVALTEASAAFAFFYPLF